MRIIAGAYKGRAIHAPKGIGTRPSSDRLREALMSILGARLDNARVLDAFAGSGALGLEALSRGASACTFIESDKSAMAVLKRNAAALGVESEAHFINGDALIQIPALGVFDIVFLDPPYASELAQQAAALLSQGHIAQNGLIIAETDTKKTVRPPEGFALCETRRYGQAMLHFIKGVN